MSTPTQATSKVTTAYTSKPPASGTIKIKKVDRRVGRELMRRDGSVKEGIRCREGRGERKETEKGLGMTPVAFTRSNSTPQSFQVKLATGSLSPLSPVENRPTAAPSEA